MSKLIEDLAALEHDRWSRWESHRAQASNPENEARWKRQRETPYSELSEAEKESDRKEVRETLAVLKRYNIVISPW